MSIKLYKTKDARMNGSAPHKCEIYYTDQTCELVEYLVDYGFEIAVYESDQCDSERLYTISPFDADIIEIHWLE